MPSSKRGTIVQMYERIAAFIDAPDPEAFNHLALEACRFQVERIEPYRRLCEERNVNAEEIDRWQDIPMIPTSAFKSVRLCAAEPQVVFRSSGTTQDTRRSEHHHPFLDLYRRTIESSFPRFCLPQEGRCPLLSLIPTGEKVPDSSLSFMVDHALERYGDEGSTTVVGKRGIEAARLRSWLGSHQRKNRPVLILATALSLHQALEAITRLGVRFRLPAGSAVFETGGFKGKESEIQREDLVARAADTLHVASGNIVREYGMTELTSQAYTKALSDGDPDLFFCPPWMRARILDPATLQEQPDGEEGMIALLDLANIGSALHLLTEDLGVADAGGFRLRGRAEGAELRGCSLTAEELERSY